MKSLKVSIFLCFFVIVLSGYAQKFPQNYFASPLQISPNVTGAFAEIRSNHFHSGVDFKTQGKEGLPILAVADGYVSRIKVSPVGFGKALYIDHPNGYTSVYGHLLNYNTALAAYVIKQQYKSRSFAVDLFPAQTDDTLWIKKGDVIGFSGNSGTSYGAHLHFEIRTTATERILNPFLLGFRNNDFYEPYFDLFKVFPMDDESSIGASRDQAQFQVKNIGTGKYRLSGNDTLLLWGRFAFGVQAFDYTYSREDRNGYYGIRMKIDDKSFFSMQCDSFSFDETRYINACIDYAANYHTGNRILKSYRLPGNRMSFIDTFNDNGVVTLTDGLFHELVIEVYDFKGNTSRLTIPVLSKKPDKLVSVTGYTDADTSCSISWNTDIKFGYEELLLNIPSGALYEDAELIIDKELPVNGLYSSRYRVHSPEIPLHKRITISLDAGKVPSSLLSKALIVRINPKNARRSSEGGKVAEGRITAEINEFGTFAIALDTIRPSIKLIHQKASAARSLKFTVTDNLAGITGYYGEVNGKWALVEWDPKNRLMIYRYDDLLQKGKNTFKLSVTDAAGNAATYSTSVFKK